MEGEETRLVELKYCERCGGLWLRPWGSKEVYCRLCVFKMAELPVPRRKGKVRLPVGPGLELEGCVGEVTGICAGGGRA